MGIHPFTLIVFVAIVGAGGALGFSLELPWIAPLGVALGLVFILSIRIARQWQRAVILRFGKFKELQGPGFVTIIPFVDTIPYWVDLRTITTPFTAEQTLTKDSVPVDVDAVLFWRVVDPMKAALEVESYTEAISWSAQTALRDVIGETSLAEMLVGRQKIDTKLREMIDQRTEAWGIHVLSVELRDVKIPAGLQDAMSMQAQAERERQARVILGESEVQVAEKFRTAAKSYVDNPTALHLRGMNILLEGMRQNSTIVLVPSSAMDTMGAGSLAAVASLAKPKSPAKA